MQKNKTWSRRELLIAFRLYCQTPFGKMHSRNPEILEISERIGRTPSALAMKLTNIASLDPVIIETGRRGLAGASKADKKMWDEMQANWEAFAIESGKAFESICNSFEDSDAPESESEKIIDHTAEDKVVKSKARIGQDFFRKSVLSAYNNHCCISGLSIPKLLVASHIIPWHHDKRNRLNPRNGLLLSMIHDKAFDTGIITIQSDMTVVVSKKVNPMKDSFFDIALKKFHGKKINLPDKFIPDKDFLEYHRKNIFEH